MATRRSNQSRSSEQRTVQASFTRGQVEEVTETGRSWMRTRGVGPRDRAGDREPAKHGERAGEEVVFWLDVKRARLRCELLARLHTAGPLVLQSLSRDWTTAPLHR